MLETSARLLRLLSLLQSRREWPGGDLAERLEVTPRTVRRDVDKLRSLGYPVHATSGTAGGYRLGAGAALPPLLLDDEEAVAVAVGLRTAAGSGVAGIGETSVRALAKLEQVLPSRLRRRVGALQTYTARLPGWGPEVAPDVLTLLAGACRDSERVRFDYRNRDGSGSRRIVEPYRLVSLGRRWYLVAWDVDRDDWRNFRVDRMEPRPPPGPRFEPRDHEAGDRIAEHLQERLSSPAAHARQARVLLRESMESVAARSGWASGTLEAVDDESCLLLLGAPTVEELALHIVMRGCDFEVLEPPELVEQVRVLADRLQRALPDGEASLPEDANGSAGAV